MKIIREIVLLFMLSFVTPAINAMSIVAVPRAAITLTVEDLRTLRTRHRRRRHGQGVLHSDFVFVHYYIAA